jgi:hypothetical protein
VDKPDFRKEAGNLLDKYCEDNLISELNEGMIKSLTQAYLRGRQSMRDEAAQIAMGFRGASFTDCGGQIEGRIRSIEIGGDNG